MCGYNRRKSGIYVWVFKVYIDAKREFIDFAE